MSSTHKTIRVNPDSFNVKKKRPSKRLSRTQTQKGPSSNVIQKQQLKAMRKNFLNKLNQKSAVGVAVPSNSPTLGRPESPLLGGNRGSLPLSPASSREARVEQKSEFDNSMQFLTLVREKNDARRERAKTIKHTQMRSEPLPLPLPLPISGGMLGREPDGGRDIRSTPLISMNRPAAISPVITLPQPQKQHLRPQPQPQPQPQKQQSPYQTVPQPPPPQVYPPPPPIVIQPDLPWGVLKSGKKPTYRTWKNTTQRRHHRPPLRPPTLSGDVAAQPRPTPAPAARDIEPSLAPAQSSEPTPDKRRKRPAHRRSKKTTKTKSRKRYTVGKSKKNRTVRVLLKNKLMRNKITAAKNALRHVPIADVRMYLKKHNLLSLTGTNTPHALIREIYENAIMAGEIFNINKDVPYLLSELEDELDT